MPFLVPLFIFKFAQSFPLVQLNIRELTTEACIDGLLGGSLDSAILAGPLRERGIKERILFYESFFLYAHENSKILSKSKLKASDIDPAELWLLMDGHCFRNQVLSFCGIDQGPTNLGSANTGPVNLKSVKLAGGSLEVLRRVVKSTWGYTLIPEMMLESLTSQERSAQVRPFVQPVPMREISLAFGRQQWKQDIVDALETVVKACLPKQFSGQPGSKNQVLEVHRTI